LSTASGRGRLAILLGLSFEHTGIRFERLPLLLLQGLDVYTPHAPMTCAFGFARLRSRSASRQNTVP